MEIECITSQLHNNFRLVTGHNYDFAWPGYCHDLFNTPSFNYYLPQQAGLPNLILLTLVNSYLWHGFNNISP